MKKKTRARQCRQTKVNEISSNKRISSNQQVREVKRKLKKSIFASDLFCVLKRGNELKSGFSSPTMTRDSRRRQKSSRS